MVNSPDAPALVAFYERYFGLRLSDWWGTAGPGEDLFALWHRTPPETGLWVPAPV